MDNKDMNAEPHSLEHLLFPKLVAMNHLDIIYPAKVSNVRAPYIDMAGLTHVISFFGRTIHDIKNGNTEPIDIYQALSAEFLKDINLLCSRYSTDELVLGVTLSLKDGDIDVSAGAYPPVLTRKSWILEMERSLK